MCGHKTSCLILMLLNLRNMKQVISSHIPGKIFDSTQFLGFLQKLQPTGYYLILQSIQNFLPQSHKLVNSTSTKTELKNCLK